MARLWVHRYSNFCLALLSLHLLLALSEAVLDVELVAQHEGALQVGSVDGYSGRGGVHAACGRAGGTMRRV